LDLKIKIFFFQTENGHLIIYHLALPVDVKTLYELQDPPAPSLKRERDELYVKEIIPPLFFSLVRSLLPIFTFHVSNPTFIPISVYLY
jgi:hypothetical protein